MSELKQRATKPSYDDLKKIPFPNGGIMFYFSVDKKFIYVRGRNKRDLSQRIEIAKKSGKKVQLYPMEVELAYMREGLTEDNIGNFYEQDIIRFNMTSDEFLQNHMDSPTGIIHTKSKGTMKGEEFWIKKYVSYDGNPRNISILRV